jgi:hypothetical protein
MRPVLAEEAEGTSAFPDAEATYVQLISHSPSAIASYRYAVSAKKQAPPAYNAAWACNWTRVNQSRSAISKACEAAFNSSSCRSQKCRSHRAQHQKSVRDLHICLLRLPVRDMVKRPCLRGKSPAMERRSMSWITFL